jgi:lysophospholipase L1-like esterase
MRLSPVRSKLAIFPALLLFGLLTGCGGGGGDEEDKLSNPNPGSNNVNVVVAFGDSITQGSQCSCTPYPKRLAGLIGKTVYNTGAGGSLAIDNVDRTQKAINRFHPGFMLILYGVNDMIHSQSTSATLGAINDMVAICKTNNTVPVLATYPPLILSHSLFAYRTRLLNEGIRNIATAEGIKCVDLETEFGSGAELYEDDGLHPNDAGTQIIAAAFADLF